MGIVHKQADDFDTEANGILDEMLRAHHPELVRRGVTVGLLFAFGPRDKEGRLTAPALTAGGYHLAGIAKVHTEILRAQGLPDALIRVDGDRWPTWNLRRRQALIDHELTHLVLDGEVDAHLRPKLSIRLHDVQVGWFAETAERWGKDSFEVEQGVEIVSKYGQLFFEFPDDAPATLPGPGSAAAPARRRKGEPVGA